MCGIVGAVSTRALPASDAFEDAAGRLAHRGPDDSGSFSLLADSVCVRLHHRRLSIIDLSPAGRQPLGNEDGSIQIAFNGEIYNYVELRGGLRDLHRFASGTDTEVIVHLYEEVGAACFEKLDGMFAFALWDGRTEELLLVRDRAGMKPLYYAARGRSLFFASELKALRPLIGPLAIDDRSLLIFLDLGYIPHDRTIYEGVRKLEPGHFLRWRRGAPEVSRYWRPPPLSAASHSAPHEFAERFSRAVQIHCRSDVEVGLFLSGGLDSSCLLAAMHEAGQRTCRSFSISFPGMGHYDERPYAEAVARHFGSAHVSLDVTPNAREIIGILPSIFDEPFADSSAIPTYYLSKLAAEHVKVVLTGTGADDVLAGYRKYHLERYRRRLCVVPGWALRLAARSLALFPATRRTSLLEEVLLARRFLRSLSETARLRYLATLRPLDETLLLGLLSDEMIRRAGADAESLRRELRPPAEDDPSLHDCLVADFETYLSGDLLVKEDRLAMHFSLEGRMPFLDADLVDFCLSLGEEWLLHRGAGKYILRLWARDRLPPRIVARKKHGFAVPMAEWLRGPLRELGEEAVADAPAHLFQRNRWQAIWNEHLAGHADRSQTLYNLIVFCGWSKEAEKHEG